MRPIRLLCLGAYFLTCWCVEWLDLTSLMWAAHLFNRGASAAQRSEASFCPLAGSLSQSLRTLTRLRRIRTSLESIRPSCQLRARYRPDDLSSPRGRRAGEPGRRGGRKVCVPCQRQDPKKRIKNATMLRFSQRGFHQNRLGTSQSAFLTCRWRRVLHNKTYNLHT